LLGQHSGILGAIPLIFFFFFEKLSFYYNSKESRNLFLGYNLLERRAIFTPGNIRI
jgi:hypothetical protein